MMIVFVLVLFVFQATPALPDTVALSKIYKKGRVQPPWRLQGDVPPGPRERLTVLSRVSRGEPQTPTVDSSATEGELEQPPRTTRAKGLKIWRNTRAL